VIAKTKEFLGEAVLDLSKYADSKETSEKLPLAQCKDPNAYIEVRVKARDSPPTPQ
jgi:hypothetical protein